MKALVVLTIFLTTAVSWSGSDHCEALSIHKAWHFGATEVGHLKGLVVPVTLTDPSIHVSQISMNLQTTDFDFLGGAYPGAFTEEFYRPEAMVRPCGPTMGVPGNHGVAVQCLLSLSFYPVKNAVYTDSLSVDYLANEDTCHQEIKLIGSGVSK